MRDAAAAVSTHLELQLAESEIHRVRQLVSSHHQVHDMIARAAPLHDVLVAICETIERYDPTLVASVLQLDPLSMSFHSGVGPSLPADVPGRDRRPGDRPEHRHLRAGRLVRRADDHAAT